MAPVTPDPARIRGFPDAAAFDAWLAEHHGDTELWLEFYKKGSGIVALTYAEAVEVALCWGWIDGIAKSIDSQRYLQRFTPRRPKSIWSQKNRDTVARLMAGGRMRPPGLAEVEAAKANGRWDAAYASPAGMAVPEDLASAIASVPAAQATFEALSATNRYALAFRLGNLRTEAGRRKAIARYVDMLARGETPHPNRGGKPR